MVYNEIVCALEILIFTDWSKILDILINGLKEVLYG